MWVLVALILIILTIFLVRAFDSRSMSPPRPEHRVRLVDEYRVGLEAEYDWEKYRALEQQLATATQAAIGPREAVPGGLDRYGLGSASNPSSYPTNWNLSYRLGASVRTGAAVLLHGLTDSPYSVLSSAQLLQEQGFDVFAPRLPGHGFAVGDLRHTKWEDWLSVTRLAMRAADQSREPGQPLILLGYSNGGLLAVRYALECREHDDLPCPDRLVLLSPAISVTPFARFGQWHRLLSWSGYFEKFQWESVLPEIDPFKFTSFPKSPGRELDLAARALQIELRDKVDRLPPMLTFLSVADDTVSTDAVIELHRRLPNDESQLVLYDVNRNHLASGLLAADIPTIAELRERLESLPGRVTVLRNERINTNDVVAETYLAGGPASTNSLGLSWPADIYSLSHIAIPFEPSDPIYGRGVDGKINLGGVAPKGERKVLNLSPAYFARLRYNPFYAYQRERIVAWLNNSRED